MTELSNKECIDYEDGWDWQGVLMDKKVEAGLALATST